MDIPIRITRSILAITNRTIRLYLKRLLLLGTAFFMVSRLYIWYMSSDGTVTNTVLLDRATSSAMQNFYTYSQQMPAKISTRGIHEQNHSRNNSFLLLKSASATSTANSTDDWHKLIIAVKRVRVTLIKHHLKDELKDEYYQQPINSHVHNFSPFLHNPIHVCSVTNASQASPFLVVLALSSYREEAVREREAIRATYGSVTRGLRWPKGKPLVAPVKLLFLLGTPPTLKDRQLVQTESARYGDMLVAGFVDSYRNLTLKVLHGLGWVLHHCPQAKFILKVDDDIFVNMPLLTAFLLTRGQNNSIYGYLYPPSVVYREGRWGVSKKEYPFKNFPPYVSGTGYVISTDAAAKILQASSRFPLVPVEDAFITGILPQVAGIQQFRCTRFTSFGDTKAKVCDFSGDFRFTGNKMHFVEKLILWIALENTDSNSCTPSPYSHSARDVFKRLSVFLRAVVT